MMDRLRTVVVKVSGGNARTNRHGLPLGNEAVYVGHVASEGFGE